MKSFLVKLAVFSIIVIPTQILIASYITPVPQVKLLDGSLQDRDQIIFFGDSSVLNTANSVNNSSSIIEMVQHMNPTYTFGNVAYPGHQLGVYEAEMDYISRSPFKPKAVIIPIQLRSFSPEWDIRPVNQFEKETFLLTDHTSFISYFYTPLAILQAINVNTIPYSEFLETPVYYGRKQIGVVNDFEAVDKSKPATEENIRNDYIYKYMFSLDENNRRVKSLTELLDLAKRSGVEVYAYISPIDYENGTKYVGKDFVTQTAANAELICAVLTARNFPCLNLAFGLGSEHFDYPAYPNEHLTADGKMFVARQINQSFFKEQPLKAAPKPY